MKTHLNLMPMRYRRGQLIRRRLKQWVLLWLLSAGCTVLLGWTQWAEYHTSASRLAALRVRYEPIEAIKGQVAGLQEKIDALQRRESLALSLADERSMLGLVGLLSQAKRACDGRISIGQLSLVRSGNSQSATNVLTLTGVAPDDIAVSQFASALRAAHAFAAVDLKATGVATVGDKGARSYTLECNF